MGTLVLKGSNTKTKRNLNETDMLQVSITLSTGVIRLQLSYFRFKVIKRRVVFYDDHILGAK